MTIRGEYDLVERPFCEQLQRMGWEWIEGDTDLPLPPLGQIPRLAHRKWTAPPFFADRTFEALLFWTAVGKSDRLK